MLDERLTDRDVIEVCLSAYVDRISESSYVEGLSERFEHFRDIRGINDCSTALCQHAAIQVNDGAINYGTLPLGYGQLKLIGVPLHSNLKTFWNHRVIPSGIR